MWIAIPFAVVMIGAPLPLVLLSANAMLRPLEPEDRAAVAAAARPARKRFVVAWAAACGVTVLTLIPAVASGVPQAAFWIGMIGFHVLWWPFGMPVLNSIRQDLIARGVIAEPGTAPVRSAGLKPRRLGDYLPRGAGAVPAVLAVVVPLLIGWRLVRYPVEEPRLLLAVGLFTLCAFAFLVGYGFWLRREVLAPFPVEGPASPANDACRRAAEDLRRFRIRIVYALQLAGAGVFAVAALLTIEVARGALRESSVGWIGGLLGTAVGIAGGVLGTWAGLRAHRLETLRGKSRSEAAARPS